MSNACLYDLARIRIYRRCDGYYLRWYYNGWHYWFFYPGSITFATEGENYWTLGTQKMTIGTGQISEEQCNAIRTIQNTKEIYIYTDSGWGVVRVEHNSLIVYDHALHGYEIEITIIIGSRAISSNGFSPAISLPTKPVDAPWECLLSIVVAGQTWMCANWDADYPGSKVYNNDETNRDKFGGLYTYAQIMSAGFVPAGWHVPIEAEWQTLVNALGGDAAAGGELKAIGTTYWNVPNTGAVDSVNFDARGGGYYSLLSFGDVYQYGWFWCADAYTGFPAYVRAIRFDYNSGAISFHNIYVTSYLSLRLIKDEYIPAPHALLLTTTGTGAGVMTMLPQVSIDTVLTLDGAAHFYADLAATIDLGQTYTVTAGSVTQVFIKCPTGTSNLTFTDKDTLFYLQFSGYTNCPEVSGSIAEFSYLEQLQCTTVHTDFSHTTAELPRPMTYLYLSGTGVSFLISGDVVDLPTGLTTLYLYLTNALSGDIGDLPAGLVTFAALTGNTLTGDLAGLPATLTYFLVLGSNTINGDVNDILGNLQNFTVQGSNTITGDVADLPATIILMDIQGSNTLSGDVADLPVGCTQCYIVGLNTVHGALADIPATIRYFSCQGNNTIDGDFGDLSNTMQYFYVRGNNTIADYSGKSWNTYTGYYIYNDATGIGGLSAAEIDQFLIDIDADCAFTGSYKVIRLRGTHAAPTAASAAARASLIAKGVTLQTN